MGDRSRPCSVWLGSETGILKGVSLARRQAFNFCDAAQLSRGHEVHALCWGDAAESELLLAAADGTVRTFSVEKGAFTEARRLGDPADGPFVGLAALPDSALVTCAESGALRLWRELSAEPVAELSAGKHVCRMRQNPARPHAVATGGKDVGLKVWDLQRPDAPLFAAKNLRDDWLLLRRPHWVRDLAFLPDSDKLVTCTAYHQVHVFDPATPQRRPVLEAEFGEHPLTALSLPADGLAVVVGNAVGQMAVLDLRKGLVRGCLKGSAGSVRGLQCHPSRPVVASCGLDRFLRIHSLEDRRLLHKVYLKSRLNCLLLSSRDPEEQETTTREVKEEDGDNEVWDTMEEIQEAEDVPAKRKQSEEEEEPLKKSRKKKAQAD